MPAVKRVRLTTNRIATLRCPQGKKQAFLWDSEVPGLAVRVTATGTKAFVAQGEFHGKTKRKTLSATDLDAGAGRLLSIAGRRQGGRRRSRGHSRTGIGDATGASAAKARWSAALHGRHRTAGGPALAPPSCPLPVRIPLSVLANATASALRR